MSFSAGSLKRSLISMSKASAKEFICLVKFGLTQSLQSNLYSCHKIIDGLRYCIES